jgi:hypothetical protein
MTNAFIASPVIGSGAPTTAASATAGWDTSALISVVEAVAGDVHHAVDPAKQPEVAPAVALARRRKYIPGTGSSTSRL